MTTSSTSPYRTLSPEETEDIASRILYEDNHVLVLNKRPGEIVQGDKTGDEPLVEKLKAFIALRDRKPGQVFMGVPHRLDRPVSGAVILAKTSKALTRTSGRGDPHLAHPQREAEQVLQPSAAAARSQGGPPALPPAASYQEIFSGGGGAAHRPPSPDPLPACLHRLPHQGRPQIRSAALQPGRQHKPARPSGDISPSHPEGAGDCHRSHPHGGDVALTLPLLYGIPRIWTERP